MSAEQAGVAKDSSKAEFWEQRYRDNATGWDFGGIPADFRKHIDTLPSPSRVLIPGCGSAYEALHLAALGWDVVAIDFSEAALERAAGILGSWRSVLKKADFFDLEGPFNLVYERAFLGALPPSFRRAYSEQVTQIVPPRGQLFGYFLIGETPEQGPPYWITDADLCGLLAPDFERIVDITPDDTLNVFKGKERFQVWQRRIT